MKCKQLTAVFFVIAFSAQASASESSFYGLLRSRDLSPFGFTRLDMRPAHAVSIDTGSWVFETELGYQNTWALSRPVEDYLKSLEPSGRRKIGPAEVQAIQQLPGENYLLDVETAAFDLTLHYKISSKWAVYAIASAVTYQGGFLDSTIEDFHDIFGFSTFGRPAVARNQTTLIYDLKNAQIVGLESPTDGGFTDPTIGFRYNGFQFGKSWKLSFDAAAKIPLQGRRLLLSTGRADFGIQASLQKTSGRNAFYLDAAAVYYGGTLEPAPQDEQIIPTLVFGYERVLTQHTNINIQGYISKSVYSHDQTDLEELLGMKYQYSIGLRHRVNSLIFRLALRRTFKTSTTRRTLVSSWASRTSLIGARIEVKS